MKYFVVVFIILLLNTSFAGAHPHGADRPPRFVSPAARKNTIDRNRFEIGTDSSTQSGSGAKKGSSEVSGTSGSGSGSRFGKGSSGSLDGSGSGSDTEGADNKGTLLSRFLDRVQKPNIAGTTGIRDEDTGTATVTGTVDTDGEPTVAWFEWGNSPTSLTHKTGRTFLKAGASLQKYSNSFKTTMRPLYYRSVAFNKNGITRGNVTELDSGTIVTDKELGIADAERNTYGEVSIRKEAKVSEYGFVDYTISVSNTTSEENHDVVVTDSLLFVVAPLLLSISDDGVYSKEDRLLMWYIDTLAPNETRVLSYTVATEESDPVVIAGGQATVIRGNDTITTPSIHITSESGEYEYAYGAKSNMTDKTLSARSASPFLGIEFLSGFIGTIIRFLSILLLILFIALAGLMGYEKYEDRLKLKNA